MWIAHGNAVTQHEPVNATLAKGNIDHIIMIKARILLLDGLGGLRVVTNG